MDEHFVTVVLRVPEFVAADMCLWRGDPRRVRRSCGGYIIQHEWVHTIGTLPDKYEDVADYHWMRLTLPDGRFLEGSMALARHCAKNGHVLSDYHGRNRCATCGLML